MQAVQAARVLFSVQPRINTVTDSQAAEHFVPSEHLMFEEAMPLEDLRTGFHSECRPDKKIKVDDLFRFRRGRGDLQVSIIAMLLALFFFAAFFTHTGWQKRKLPDELGTYLSHQVGLTEMEGRVPRFGRILKQGWVIPMLCLLLLLPTALWNFKDSLGVHRWRKRFMLPTDARYEVSQYLAALEFVAYFIVYTLMVPILGYLLSTIFLGLFLTYRLGYRSKVWILRSLATGVAIVLVFRTFLQIKTPASIWLYDQLPSAMRAFMLTYF